MRPDLSTSENPNELPKWSNVIQIPGEAIFLLSGVVSALIIRLILIPQDTTINVDGVYYATLGRKIILGNFSEGISAYWSPFYSLLIGISSLFFQDLEFAARFVSIVAGSLLIIPSYFLIRNFYGLVPAYIGTILVVIHPSLIKSSQWVMTEAIYALIFTTIILTGWHALKNFKALTFFFTGLLLGIACLIKPEAMGFVILFSSLMLAVKLLYRKIHNRRLAMSYLMLFIGLTIFVVPYVIFVHQKTGNWTISQKLLLNVPAVASGANKLKLIDYGETTMMDRLFLDDYKTENQSPISSPQIATVTTESIGVKWDFKPFISKSFTQLYKQLREHIPSNLPYFFIFLAGFGFLFKSWTIDRLAKEIYLFLFVACLFIGYAVTVIEERYIYTIIPILMAWVAYGAIVLGRLITKTASQVLKTHWKIKPVFVQVLMLLILTAILWPLFSSKFEPVGFDFIPFEEKQAGLWLKQYSALDPLVMASNATVPFYAGGRQIFVPDEEFPTVLEYARRKKVNYIVLSERRLKNNSDAFRIADKYWSEELKLVYQDEQVPSYNIKIYQIEF